ncbi:TPA: accessory Sec system protein translocase subunit SecY2 [Streptococcus suis]
MKKFFTSSLVKRISWTIAILFIYMLGRYIPLATFPENIPNQSKLAESLNTLAMVTGGELSRLNLFSLGLSPWMTSMILWRFVATMKINKYFTDFQNHVSQMLLLSAIAAIQAVGYLSMIQSNQVTMLQNVSTVIVMIAGSFVLQWFSNINTQIGLGGSSAIIATGVVLNIITSLANLDSTISDSLLATGFFILILLFAVYITIVFYLAEYRIPIKRITINSRLVKSSYLPIRITPAGGMPFMYAITLMSFPILILNLFSSAHPEIGWLRTLQDELAIAYLPGIILYNAILFLLSYGFAYFNLDPADVAENMQKNGDYIAHVRPGRDTQRYLTKYLNRMAFIGAIYTCLMGGLPLFIVWWLNLDVSLGMLLNQIYIVTTLMLSIVEQVDIIQSWKKYQDII